MVVTKLDTKIKRGGEVGCLEEKGTCFISDILSHCINVVRIKIKGYVEGLKAIKSETVVSNEPEKLFHKSPSPSCLKDGQLHSLDNSLYSG